MPSVKVGSPYLFYDLEEKFLSHLYINPNAPLEHGNHTAEGPFDLWVCAAQYHIALDGSTSEANEAKETLNCRQEYAFSVPFDGFEPSGCVRAATVYPQLSFSYFKPTSGLGFRKVGIEKRIEWTPQENLYSNDQYLAGLFRDKDTFQFKIQKGLPLGTLDCQPLPFWSNIFDPVNTIENVTKEIIFDTNYSDPTFLSPDNIHLHHARTLPALPLSNPFYSASWSPFEQQIEAPGSYNGTIHMHWRWSKDFSGFGGGEPFTPAGQIWTMALARSNFPADYDEFVSEITGQDIGLQAKTFLMSCDQNQVLEGREHTTFSTGFSYSLGPAATDDCAILGTIEQLGGTRPLSCGFRSDNGCAAVLDASIALGQYFSFLSGIEECDTSSGRIPIAKPAKNEKTDASQEWIYFKADKHGGATPFSVNSEKNSIQFSSTDSTSPFFVVENMIEDSPVGFHLAQPAGNGGGRLNISFSNAVTWVARLPIAARSSVDQSICIKLYSFGQVISTTNVALTVSAGDQFAGGIIDLHASVPIERIEISSPEGFELAIGPFLVGYGQRNRYDLDGDGFVGESDQLVFAELFTGSDVALLGPDIADFDGDGDVDESDYSVLRANLQEPSISCLAAFRKTNISEKVDPLSTHRIDAQVTALEGNIASYEWRAENGVLLDSDRPISTWISPEGDPSSPISEIITLRVELDSGCFAERRFIRYLNLLTYEVWMSSFGLPSEFRLEAVDYDGDGMTNLQEFNSNTDPTNPLSKLDILRVTPRANRTELIWTSGAVAVQTVQTSVDGGETWLNLRDYFASRPGQKSLLIQGETPPHSWFRVRTSRN